MVVFTTNATMLFCSIIFQLLKHSSPCHTAASSGRQQAIRVVCTKSGQNNQSCLLSKPLSVQTFCSTFRPKKKRTFVRNQTKRQHGTFASFVLHVPSGEPLGLEPPASPQCSTCKKVTCIVIITRRPCFLSLPMVVVNLFPCATKMVRLFCIRRVCSRKRRGDCCTTCGFSEATRTKTNFVLTRSPVR